MTASPARCIACGAEARERFRAGGVEIRRCAGCGLAWRSDFPEAAELAPELLEPLRDLGFLD